MYIIFLNFKPKSNIYSINIATLCAIMLTNFKKHLLKYVLLTVLIILCIAINQYSKNSIVIEKEYSTTIYPLIAGFCRSLVGWITFSVGDFLWAFVIVYLLLQFFKMFRFLFIKKYRVFDWYVIKNKIVRIALICLSIYIIFNILWGINYNRQGIAKQIDLEVTDYSVAELENINSLLVFKINAAKQILVNSKSTYLNNKQLFVATENAYKNIAKTYSFLAYTHPAIKASMWGWLGNYTGFLGYYNPITAEAQVNTTVPKFTQPFTACHEVAHQMGYAKEMEANFVGYLAAAASTDTLFHYSVYVELYTYANRTLYFADTTAALQSRKLLLPAVLLDFKERREFNLTHTSIAEPVISYLYGKFLQSNQQPLGVLSYDEVTAFIIAYYKKFGKI